MYGKNTPEPRDTPTHACSAHGAYRPPFEASVVDGVPSRPGHFSSLMDCPRMQVFPLLLLKPRAALAAVVLQLVVTCEAAPALQGACRTLRLCRNCSVEPQLVSCLPVPNNAMLPITSSRASSEQLRRISCRESVRRAALRCAPSFSPT